MLVLCLVSKDKRAKCRTVKTNTQVRMKFRVHENNNNKKKSPGGDMDV
jgi:hypothetical protein